MNIELQELSKGPVYLQVREQIETQIKQQRLSRPAKPFPLPRRWRKNSRSIKARFNALTSNWNTPA